MIVVVVVVVVVEVVVVVFSTVYTDFLCTCDLSFLT